MVLIMAPRCAKDIDHDGNSDGGKTDWVLKEAGRFGFLVVIGKRSMATTVLADSTKPVPRKFAN